MAVSAVITCPSCKKKFKGRPELEGKRIRCPACGDDFIVRGVAIDQPGAAAPAPEAKPAAKGKASALWTADEDDPNPYGVTTLDIAPRCPHCANLMESEEAVVCLHCGYNTQTRQLPEIKKMVAHTGGERFMWLLPGILCVVGIIILINLDIFYCLLLPDMVHDTWAEFTDHESMRLWTVIPTLFAMWTMGYFGYKRLIMNPVPPEKVKN